MQILAISAMTLLVLSITNSCKTEVNLKKKYYKTLPIPTSKSGRIRSEKFDAAMVDYAAGNFKDAYNKIGQVDFYDDEKKLYLAICLVEMDRAQEGIDIMVWLDDNTLVTRVKQHVDWYLTVLNLDTNREMSKKYLTKILTNQKHRHYEEALALQSDLK